MNSIFQQNIESVLKALEAALAESIAKSVNESAEDTILGFIDVDETTQQQILEALRNGIRIGTLRGMLKQHPCLTAYGLAVAAPIGMKDDDIFSGGFYTAWQASFGYMPDQQIREPLGLAFNRILDSVGLQTGTISPDQPIHYKGGCYLYQSGILPHFIQPLRMALDGALKRRPLPDPDDDQQCEAFGHLLADIVHPAQVRLRRTLQSQIGGFLVRRLVRWHLTGDDNLFPAHLRELLAEQKGRAVFANSPFLSFDENNGEIQLVLPAQGGKLADSNTRWTVSGLPSMRAISERPPIPLSEIPCDDDDFVVSLSHLRGDLENIDFKLRHGLSATCPLLVFDQTRNREQRLSLLSDEIRLRPGQDYLIVIGKDVEVTSGHEIEIIGESRCLRYTSNPGNETPVLRSGNRSWTIKPAIKAGLYMAREEATQLHVTSLTESKPVLVSYGKGFHLTCCIPSDLPAERVTFSTLLDPAFTRSVGLPSGIEQAGLKMVDLSDLLAKWLEELPDAILRIEVRVSLPTRSLALDWIFWKGLERLTIYGDIRWNGVPRNLSGHPGFRSTPHGLDREARDRGQAELRVTGLGTCETVRWKLPSNRVQVFMLQEDGSAEPVNAGEQIDLISSDNRVIQFNSGGLMPVRLTANGKELGIVSPDRPSFCCYPAALLAEIGKAATVRAETLLPVPGEKAWPLVSWQSPLSAKECRLPETAAATMTWKIRKISLAGLAGLRVSLRRIDDGIRSSVEPLHAEIQIPSETGESEPLVPVPGITIIAAKTEKWINLRIDFERAAQKGAVWSLEVEGRADEAGVWQTLVVLEAYGRLARIRFVMIGDDPVDDSAIRSLFWGDVRDDVLQPGSKVSLTPSEIRRAISEMSILLSWKYPTPVWQQNAKRLKGACAAISSAASADGPEGQSAWWTWAVESLARHAAESQPVVIPELPILHGFQIAASPLKGCSLSGLGNDGWIERCFIEAFVFESRNESGCLAYLQQALENGRLELSAISQFEGFNQLISGKDVPLGKARLRDWMMKVSDDCKSLDPDPSNAYSALLSAEHLMHCLSKARRRCHVLTSITSADYGQWLSGPISRLHTHHDAVESLIHDLLGPMLQSVPVEVLWKPYTDSSMAAGGGETTQLMRTLMAGNLLIALVLRRHASGMLKWNDAMNYLRKIVGGDNSQSRLHDQAGLMIGTAPELFSFYFLLFTLTR
jgi:hypothetical protein